MPITKLLIAPAERLIPSKRGLIRYLKNVLRPDALFYDGELLVYADIPKLLGSNNCFILGGLHQHLYNPVVPPLCPYPSCHGTAVGTRVEEKQLNNTMRQVDAVLLSTRSPFARNVIQLARQQHKPIAIVDFPDHEDLYGTAPTPNQIYRGFKHQSDFDLYFKKDLMPSIANDFTLPLEPAPVRPSSYSFPQIPKTASIFYSGRARMERVQPDRAEIVSLVQQHFPDANIVVHNDRQSFMTKDQYCRHLAGSNLALSPSGRIWGSFRHCETGLAPRTGLIAPQPYIATTGAPLIDGKNAILYDVKEINGRYHLDNPSEIIEKIQHYLQHKDKLMALAKQWQNDVINTHTITARSQYVLNCVAKLL